MAKTAVSRGSLRGPKGDTGAPGAAGADATAIYGGKGAANGVAPLDASGHVPVVNLAARPIRTVATAVTAVVGELLEVDASGAARTITPPASPAAGDMVTLVKVDSSSNPVTWAGTVNGDPAGAQLVAGGAGATFVWVGSGWLIESVNVAYSGSGTTGGVLTTDPRLSDTRAPTDGSVTDAKVASNAAIAESKLALASDAAAGTASRRSLGTGTTQAAAGNHAHGPTAARAITYAATITPDASTGDQFYVSAPGDVVVAAPTNPTDGQRLMVEVYSSGGARTATISGTTTNAAGATLPLSIGSGKVGLLGFVYSARVGHWVLAAAVAEP